MSFIPGALRGVTFHLFVRGLACQNSHRFAFSSLCPGPTPRGKSDGGEWGVLGRGGRTKSWAPVAIASAHPGERALYMYRFPPRADRRTPPHFPLYVVPRFPPAPNAGTPAQFSPSAAPLTVSTCLWAAVGKVPPHRRTRCTWALLSSPPLGRFTRDDTSCWNILSKARFGLWAAI